jgi:hypothetical protein
MQCNVIIGQARYGVGFSWVYGMDGVSEYSVVYEHEKRNDCIT